jgi:hypothetical protein
MAASRGSPLTGSRPRTSVPASVWSGATPPTSSFTASDVVSPIASRWWRRIQPATASSKS